MAEGAAAEPQPDMLQLLLALAGCEMNSLPGQLVVMLQAVQQGLQQRAEGSATGGVQHVTASAVVDALMLKPFGLLVVSRLSFVLALLQKDTLSKTATCAKACVTDSLPRFIAGLRLSLANKAVLATYLRLLGSGRATSDKVSKQFKLKGRNWGDQ